MNPSLNKFAGAWLGKASVVVLVMFSAAAQAQFTTAGDGRGGLVILGYNGGSSMIIPGTINGKMVTGIGGSAFLNNTTITSASIPDSVTNIGDQAFESCTNLGSITFGSGLTTIGNNVFVGCSSLTDVSIPASVTSIGMFAFSSCNALTSISVAPGNTTYSSLNGILFELNQTALLQYPGGRAGPYTIPNTVTFIGQDAFYACNGLTSVTIPASVTNILNFAFDSCPNLTSAIFLGNTPSLGASAFSGAASGFTVIYDNGLNFTSPTWAGYPSANAGPFSSAPLGGGWYYSAWFGTYNANYYPWIYRTDLGFIYVSTSNNIDFYLYVLNGNSGSMGWLYTAQASFPNVYCFSENTWLYYYTGGTTFYNYTTQASETY